jgi:hypothetical protein
VLHKGQHMSLLALLVTRWTTEHTDEPALDTPGAHEFLLEVVRRGGGGPRDIVPGLLPRTVATSPFFERRPELLRRVEAEHIWTRRSPLVALRAVRLAALDAAEEEPAAVPAAAAAAAGRKRAPEAAVAGIDDGGGSACSDGVISPLPPAKRQRLGSVGDGGGPSDSEAADAGRG